ncbi:MAG: preprotein translocase subunit YajC, partial [Bacteroidales bacterium]|nr:preprotein translocase subunit YajC [Bacteroidales bacterium]
VFYFFMIRPQMKRQKDLKKYRAALQKGDKVVTTGGIYGKINAIKDNHIIVEVDENVKLKIDKSAILKDSSDISAAK